MKFKSSFTKYLIILLILIIPAFSSLLRKGYFPMHDDMQAMRLLQMDKCVKDLQIPCRWVPDMGYGYGYPQFNYYGPLPYSAMETFHLVGLGYLDSVKAGFVLSVLLSSFGMFLLGRELWGSWGGVMSALFYVYVPYRAVDMYVRGAVGEIYALAFLPFIFWAVKKVIDGDKKAILWLAVSLAALFTSHNVTSLIFAPFFGLWIVFLILINKKTNSSLSSRTQIKYLISGCFWGFLLSSFFLIPAIMEQDFVHIKTLTQGYFNYLAHFVSIKQILFSSYWGYGSSELGAFDDMNLSVGILHWSLPPMFLLIAFLKKKQYEMLVLTFLVLSGFAALFMTHQKSSFIWEQIDIFSFIQFPWRFLSIAVFTFSVAVGAFYKLADKKSRIFAGVSIVLILLLLNMRFFRPKEWININDNDKFSGELWEKQLTISIFDYLPISAKHPPSQEAFDKPLVKENGETISYGVKGTDWQRWEIVLPDTQEIVFPLYYFPEWKATVNEKQVPVSQSGDLGLVTLTLSEGENEVFITLVDTPVRKLGNILTVIGLFIIPLFLHNPDFLLNLPVSNKLPNFRVSRQKD